MVLVGFKPDLWRPTGFFQCFDTVGLVIWPVKIVPGMTYYVSSGMFTTTTTSLPMLFTVTWPISGSTCMVLRIIILHTSHAGEAGYCFYHHPPMCVCQCMCACACRVVDKLLIRNLRNWYECVVSWWTLEVIRFCWHLSLTFDLDSCFHILTVLLQ